jgi:hypothetical protein
MNPYDELFQQYVAELRAAREEVLAWWESLLSDEARKTGDGETAERAVRARWPCGPVSHPRVIAVFRKYFIRCDEINEKINEEWDSGDAERVQFGEWDTGWGVEDEDVAEPAVAEPRFVLIERVEAEDQVLGQFVNNLVFVPIGIDPEGRTA